MALEFLTDVWTIQRWNAPQDDPYTDPQRFREYLINNRPDLLTETIVQGNDLNIGGSGDALFLITGVARHGVRGVVASGNTTPQNFTSVTMVNPVFIQYVSGTELLVDVTEILLGMTENGGALRMEEFGDFQKQPTLDNEFKIAAVPDVQNPLQFSVRRFGLFGNAQIHNFIELL